MIVENKEKTVIRTFTLYSKLRQTGCEMDASSVETFRNLKGDLKNLRFARNYRSRMMSNLS